MNFKGHIIFGLTLEIIFMVVMFFWKGWFHLSLASVPIFIIVIYVSPLLPDLDHHEGTLRKQLTLFGLVLSLISTIIWYLFNVGVEYIVLGVIIASVGYLIHYITSHRGRTHTILFCLFWGLIMGFYMKRYDMFALAFLGAYSHLLADKIPFKVV